jgi:hypothetical protein
VALDGLEKQLEAAGIKGETLDRIRLARGVVGKSSYVAGAAFLALIAVAWSLREPGYLLALAVFVVLLFAVYFAGVLWFAHKHPGEALLEGAELIRWRQLEMGVKGTPALPPSPNITPPMIEGE